MKPDHATPPAPDLLNLFGRRALVTGASGNIGRGIALRLAEAGAEVVVHFLRDADGAAQTVATIKTAGGTAVAVQADLGSAPAVNDFFTQLDSAGDVVDLVVNNAAIQPVTEFADISAEQWRDVMSANLDSAFFVIQAAARRMRDRGVAGAIVNIASIEGSDPSGGHSHYATSKAGLLMLTRACALEYGHDGIRCNAVSPGLIERPGIEQSWPDGVARWREKAPLGRMGDVSDVADAVLFLLSPAARWISGTDLLVDGGMSAVSRW
ncbi:MAG: short-chain dehydrogenase [Gammaproteobacteria bacterium]|nr:MAG: short-chain dehydrogenase [Gammaproteobacteria bacterium]RLA37319.1 MAG: short-chain dehydrogenase [Gammaproteobacteria bacterium]